MLRKRNDIALHRPFDTSSQAQIAHLMQYTLPLCTPGLCACPCAPLRTVTFSANRASTAAWSRSWIALSKPLLASSSLFSCKPDTMRKACTRSPYHRKQALARPRLGAGRCGKNDINVAYRRRLRASPIRVARHGHMSSSERRAQCHGKVCKHTGPYGTEARPAFKCSKDSPYPRAPCADVCSEATGCGITVVLTCDRASVVCIISKALHP